MSAALSAPDTPDFVFQALESVKVGTWQCDLTSRLLRGDAVMAEIFGFDLDEARQGIPIDRFREMIVPEDRQSFDERSSIPIERQKIFATKYRIAVAPGVVRPLMVRGAYDPPTEPGRLATGHGIVFDAFWDPQKGLQPIHRAADAAIELHAEAGSLAVEVPGLLELAKTALHLIGRRLAQDVPLANLST